MAGVSAGGIYPKWASDGSELDYLAPDGTVAAVSVRASATTFESGAPVSLFPTRVFGGGADNQQGPQYDVTRDGRFLINTALDDTMPITLIQNWCDLARHEPIAARSVDLPTFPLASA